MQTPQTETPEVEVSIALVHWPVVDKAGNTVVTNVTNLDVHDIARASTTYGVKNYFIVNRLEDQLSFVARILDHWRTGYGKSFNPMRRTALNPLKTALTVDDAVRELEEKHGSKPVIVSTSAKSGDKRVGFSELREKIWSGEDWQSSENGKKRPMLLLFGTGYGMHEDLLDMSDYVLEPIQGMPPEDYRHLSVRSAVSICLDRLLGKW